MPSVVQDWVTDLPLRQQGVLLFDKGASGGVGQVLNGLAAQNGQLAAFRVLRAELAIGLGQIIAHQIQ